MTLAVQIIAIIFMATLIFLSIWGFILLNQTYRHFKYQNYILEKINENIALLRSNNPKNEEVRNTVPNNISKENLIDNSTSRLETLQDFNKNDNNNDKNKLKIV